MITCYIYILVTLHQNPLIQAELYAILVVTFWQDVVIFLGADWFAWPENDVSFYFNKVTPDVFPVQTTALVRGLWHGRWSGQNTRLGIPGKHGWLPLINRNWRHCLVTRTNQHLEKSKGGYLLADVYLLVGGSLDRVGCCTAYETFYLDNKTTSSYAVHYLDKFKIIRGVA